MLSKKTHLQTRACLPLAFALFLSALAPAGKAQVDGDQLPKKQRREIKKVNEWLAGIPKLQRPTISMVSMAPPPPGCENVPQPPRDLDELVAFNSLLSGEEYLWPGAVVQGGHLVDGKLDGIPGDLADITIEVVLPEAAPQILIEKPNSAKIRQAIDGVLRGKYTSDGLKWQQITIEEVESFAEMAYKLKIGPLAASKFLGMNFERNKQWSRQRLAVMFVQPLYRVNVLDPPSTSAEFFSSPKKKELMAYIGPNNPPVYISSVTYGRALVALVSSKKYSHRLKAGFSFLIKGLKFDPSAEMNATLSEFDTKVGAVGGAAPNLLGATKLSDIRSELRRFIEGNFMITESFPISYRVRYLSDNSAVEVYDPTPYAVTQCPRETFVVRLKKVAVAETKDYLGDEMFFDLRVATPIDRKVCLESTPEWYESQPVATRSREQALRKKKKEELVVRQSSTPFDVEIKDGNCFKIEGEFKERDYWNDVEVGSIGMCVCYRDGAWVSTSELERKCNDNRLLDGSPCHATQTLTGSGARWVAHLEVEKLSSAGSGGPSRLSSP